MKRITKNSPNAELENINEGDHIQDDTGKKGEVEHIEILNRCKEKQFYYKLKDDGTILIIK
jgi:hypothetical protein